VLTEVALRVHVLRRPDFEAHAYQAFLALYTRQSAAEVLAWHDRIVLEVSGASCAGNRSSFSGRIQRQGANR